MKKLHMKFCRYTLGIHRKAMKKPDSAELGKLSISLRFVCQIITPWTHKNKWPFLFKTNIWHQVTPTISHRNSMAKVRTKHFIWYWIRTSTEKSMHIEYEKLKYAILKRCKEKYTVLGEKNNTSEQAHFKYVHIIYSTKSKWRKIGNVENVLK